MECKDCENYKPFKKIKQELSHEICEAMYNFCPVIGNCSGCPIKGDFNNCSLMIAWTELADLSDKLKSES